MKKLEGRIPKPMVDLTDELDLLWLALRYNWLDLDDHLDLKWLSLRVDLRWNGFSVFDRQ
jgi:hypothetical protein